MNRTLAILGDAKPKPELNLKKPEDCLLEEVARNVRMMTSEEVL